MGPLRLVGALVCREGGLVRKALAARADVKTLFLVGQEVPVEVSHAAEAEVTVGTLVRAFGLVGRFRVGLQVPHQGRLPGERSSAFRAQVRAVLHVRALVVSVGRQGLEALATDQTIVLASVLVRVFVPLQRLFEGEAAPALDRKSVV